MSGEAEALPEFRFEAEVIYWRGPSPFFFVPVPPAEAETLKGVMKAVTYGWGMIPVGATIGGVAFTTALFPKDGTYFLPLKDKVRRKANITAGDKVIVEMAIRPQRG
ncbi:DUF1905 domain-containing protein [Phenylobacterium sp.]|jgi:hypothetical protein|uniref:DUF1905 domain-containing protein n=1 Tax=Phenylobacterium sp. TaxID=1871053 RepID=UPI002E35BC6D|nr:DUF1905 domain-containing protein [Phenylobacterium sp.]HEX2559434.1 DUF1905 domain-containing protein [Phenylobacterium sp.]